MPELDDNTRLSVPLRNLIALGAGLVMATSAYVTLDTRIIAIEHQQTIQDMTIRDNADFVREWPLGLRGALPDDLRQDSKILYLEQRSEEIAELRETVNDMQVQLGVLTSEVNDLSLITHLRAHETKANLVCRLLLEKKKSTITRT